MPISFTYESTIQLTDGNWIDGPHEYIPYEPETEQTVVMPELSDSLDWYGTLDLSVIGDFNHDGEWLKVTMTSANGNQTSTLFNPSTTDDGLFAGQDTGPSNGTDNPLLGAWPQQGMITVNGHYGWANAGDVYSHDDVWSIHDDSAVFAASDSVELSADLGKLGDDLSFSYAITPNGYGGDGVDIAQIEMTLTVSSDWSSEHAISNVVFYVACDEEVKKIKIDNWNGDYTSTDAFDFSDAKFDALAEEYGFEACDFLGMTIKAGNNGEGDFAPNQRMGEGEIISALYEDVILENYGKQNDFDLVLEASQVLDDFMVC